ncbi:unnamed protein product [Phytophthora lilii]|uniref:Unnamed protein product n=1 Tax=Phytophthora lilii TaxID=2077276 RepID=A0A9W6WLP6_9STRA|nr:unnamed protein product [Phytophthora lilii]
MLPKLELLDEEEVEFLKEMGSLHMPKYRSLMRRIAENKRNERYTSRSPYKPLTKRLDQKPNNQFDHARFRSSPLKIRTDVEMNNQREHDEFKKEAALYSPGEKLLRSAETENQEVDKQQRLVVKDCATNTDVDLEKDVLKREQAMGQREADFLEKEKVFLTKENNFFLMEKALKAKIADIEKKLESAEARATKAEATILEMSNHLLQVQKEQAAATAASDASVSATQQIQTHQQAEWDATVAALKESHAQQMEQLGAEKSKLEEKVTTLETTTSALTEKLQQVEGLLQRKSVALEKSENKTDELATEQELTRRTQEAIVTQLSDEVKYHKDRSEQADKRNTQLEKQIEELKANVETVYNKCIEKDDAIQQLKKSLATRQDEIETLRLQHVKDTERQDKLQQQQQDLYERQLQASIIQVEMEFRKEHQQTAQKLQIIQRKTHERLKEIKRVREAYQVSLQREAAAKAEIERLQAILADDKKKLFMEDTKRSDAFKAEVREERARCKELEQALVEEQKKNGQVAGLKVELDDAKIEIERLRVEIQVLEEQKEAWKKLEDDLRAALKVKDVMLADQLRQIQELTNERQQMEVQFNDELSEYQVQVEDLEAALDESLQKAAEEEVKSEALSAKLIALEESVPKKEKELISLRVELEQKVSAFEFLDQEMQRMRTVLENQDELFQKRMQKHLEQQREEMERVRAAAEEERERQLHGWEAERGEMMHKYEVLATEMESVAAQNGKLRAALDQERRKAAQNDRDMRILLAQVNLIDDF